MGCDIHVFIEKRDDALGEWYLDPSHTRDDERDVDGQIESKGRINSVAAAGRDYEMFGFMAGVRVDGGLFEPRGIPEDVSELGYEAMNQYGGDGHSHSYLSLEEFKECLDRSGYSIDDGNSTQAFYEYSDFKDYNDRPPDYTTMYRYALKWIEDEKKSQYDIVEHLRPEPEIRFIFFFDN